MTLLPQELFGPSSTQNAHKRAGPYENGIITGKLAVVSGAPTLDWLMPLHFDEATQTWKVWSANKAAAAVNEVQTYTLGGPTGGTYKLSFDGQTTTALAYNAAAAAITAALEALSTIGSGNVVASGGPSNTTAVVLTFASALAGQNVPTVMVDAALLTGSTSANPIAASTTTQGSVASQNDSLDGFLWENPNFASSATNELLCNILIKGLVDARDVPLPTGEAQADLNEAMRNECRREGLDIQGITGVH